MADNKKIYKIFLRILIPILIVALFIYLRHRSGFTVFELTEIPELSSAELTNEGIQSRFAHLLKVRDVLLDEDIECELVLNEDSLFIRVHNKDVRQARLVLGQY